MDTKLEELYKDPSFGLLSKDKFYKKVKSLYPEITKQQIGSFFSTLTTDQLHKPVPKPTNLPIVGIPGSYQMDLIFFPAFKRKNSGYDTALILVNINSRYAYGRPLKGKSQAVVNEAMREIIAQSQKDNRDIKLLESDNGSEFVSKSLQAILKSHNIEHRTAQVADHNFLGKIDRFSRTIKAMVSKYMTTYDNPRWVDAFQDLITNYNNTENRATNLAPDEITVDEEKRINDKARKKYNQGLSESRKQASLNVNDYIRIPTSKAKFEKEGQTYSGTVYQVESILGSKVEIRNPDGHVLKKKYNINTVLKVPQGSKEINTDKIKQAKKEAKVERIIRNILG